MSVLYTSTNDHTLVIDDRPVLSSGSRNVDYMEVTFDSSWTELENVTFHANFYMTNEEDGYIVDMINLHDNVYRCVIPYRAYVDSGYMFFGVFARNASSQIVKTSTVKRVRIKQGILTSSDEPPDIFEFLSQLILALNTKFDMNLDEYAETTDILSAIENNDLAENYNYLVNGLMNVLGVDDND